MGEHNKRFHHGTRPHAQPVRPRLQPAQPWAGQHGGFHRLLLPSPVLVRRALQGGPLLHRPRDLHRDVPLLPYLQLVHRVVHPVRGHRPLRQRDRDQLQRMRRRRLRLHPHRHPLQRRLPLFDWLLTVPLLLIEIVLVMKLSEEETFNRCVKLGVFSALMIANGYPGEVTGDPSTRWCFWFLSMCPFSYIVYTLFVGLKEAQEAQPEAVRDQVKWACWATVFSWCTYPVVFIFPMLQGSSTGKHGLTAGSMVAVQMGDTVSKCGVGYLVYRSGLAKSLVELEGGDKYSEVE